MMLPYSVRLVCLCLACFGLVQVFAGLIVSALANRAIALAGRLPARSAAGLLLGIRLLPAGASLVAILVLCLPSYFLLEEDAASEPVSWLCIAAALVGASVLAIGLARGVRALLRSPRVGRPAAIRIAGEECCLVDSAQPMLVLTGVFRARLLLSPPVLRALPANELSVALSHERAHRISRDNLKRLLLRLAPLPLPALDRAWSKYAEWAADDAAVHGDANRSLALASALVRFARLNAPGWPLPLASSLFGEEGGLAARVERLLAAPTPVPADFPRWLPLAAAAGLLAILLHPASLALAHRLLESLITGY